MAPRAVEIVVTNVEVGSYEARSYPHEQKDAKGWYWLYRVPVYRILVQGTDGKGGSLSTEFKAPRFMPYFNDPVHPDKHYGTKGWVNAGLSRARRIVVPRYKEDYEVQNRYSPGVGAIVMEGAFYIHAGPAALDDVGFGSAGCIEIIGDFDVFKATLATAAGLDPDDPDAAIQALVRAGKLVVTIQHAHAPNIRKQVTRKVRDA